MPVPLARFGFVLMACWQASLKPSMREPKQPSPFSVTSRPSDWRGLTEGRASAASARERMATRLASILIFRCLKRELT